MVTARTPGSDKTVFKKYFDEMVDRFGSSFTRTRDAITRDSLGNVTDSTSSTATIYGDFQVIENKAELEKYGVQGLGAGKFYCKSDSDLLERDTLSINSILWEVKKRVEDDMFENTEVSEVWLLIRLDG